jgi:hypothetical protein
MNAALNFVARVRSVTYARKFSKTLTTDPSKFKLKSPPQLQCGCRLLSVTKVLKNRAIFGQNVKKVKFCDFEKNLNLLVVIFGQVILVISGELKQKGTRIFKKSRNQGTLSEGEGSVQLTLY